MPRALESELRRLWEQAFRLPQYGQLPRAHRCGKRRLSCLTKTKLPALTALDEHLTAKVSERVENCVTSDLPRNWLFFAPFVLNCGAFSRRIHVATPLLCPSNRALQVPHALFRVRICTGIGACRHFRHYRPSL